MNANERMAMAYIDDETLKNFYGLRYNSETHDYEEIPGIKPEIEWTQEEDKQENMWNQSSGIYE
jgi:hypothetical protein